MNIAGIAALAPVIPVLTVERVADAVPLARALVAGGLPVLEVTLRTPAALEVITEMTKVPGAIVGAGTVLSGSDLAGALTAGARFIVSPGITAALHLTRTAVVTAIRMSGTAEEAAENNRFFGRFGNGLQ